MSLRRVCNGAPVLKQVALDRGDNLAVGEETFMFEDGAGDPESDEPQDASPLRRFIGALSRFSQSADSDTRFELLAAVAQLLCSDGAVPTLRNARTAAEMQCIREALRRSDGNISVAAHLLDTDRKWLTKLIKLHGISPEERTDDLPA
jgi:DNA-binding NtrC family response regulator